MHTAPRQARINSTGRPAPCRRHLGNSSRGVTLVESAITMCVAAILVSAAAPSFTQARERRHLEGVAAQVVTDVQMARSLAVARNSPVRISFSSHNGASCYVVHTHAAGACRCAADGASVCQGPAQALHTVWLGQDAPVQVTSNAGSMLFDGTQGTVTPTATIRVLARATAVHEVVNVMGRVRTCTSGLPLPGYKAC